MSICTRYLVVIHDLLWKILRKHIFLNVFLKLLMQWILAFFCFDIRGRIYLKVKGDRQEQTTRVMWLSYKRKGHSWFSVCSFWGKGISFYGHILQLVTYLLYEVLEDAVLQVIIFYNFLSVGIMRITISHTTTQLKGIF